MTSEEFDQALKGTGSWENCHCIERALYAKAYELRTNGGDKRLAARLAWVSSRVHYRYGLSNKLYWQCRDEIADVRRQLIDDDAPLPYFLTKPPRGVRYGPPFTLRFRRLVKAYVAIQKTLDRDDQAMLRAMLPSEPHIPSEPDYGSGAILRERTTDRERSHKS